MTNREALLQTLKETDWESLRCVTGYLECPYTKESDCINPHKYGTVEFQIFCDEACKYEWLFKEVEDEQIH